MKILLVTLEFPPQKGGVQAYLQNVASSFTTHGDTVVVLTVPHDFAPTFDRTEKYQIIRQRFMRWLWPRWWPLVKQIKQLHAEHRFDIFMAGELLPVGTAVRLASKQCGVPYVLHVYGLDLSRAHQQWRKQPTARAVLTGASIVFANSGYTKQQVVRWGVAQKRVEVVWPTTTIKPPAVRNRDVCEMLGIGNRTILLTVARLVERKGHDVVIMALELLRHILPNIHYVILGDGPYRDHLQNLARKHKVESMVTFLGEVSDVERQRWYACADIFIMASRDIKGDYDGFGTVLVEAAVAGLPVVTGNEGGCPDTVEDGVTGYIVPARDYHAIARVIEGLVSHPEHAQQMGVAGRRRAQTIMNWQTQFEKMRKALYYAIR